LTLCGLVLIGGLLKLRCKGALLLGVAGVTAAAWITGLEATPAHVFEAPSLNRTFFALDFDGFFKDFTHTMTVTLVMLFVAVFDTAGVQYAAGQQAGLLDEHDRLPGSKAAFFAAGAASAVGAALGTSPVIIHNETCAGINAGGRTGLTSCVVGLCFLLALPLSPLLAVIPPCAIAPPLIIVGMFMMGCAKFIDFEDVQQALPAFLTLCLIPLTYSIADGMLFGSAAYVAVWATAAAVTWLFPTLTDADDDAGDAAAGGSAAVDALLSPTPSPLSRTSSSQRFRKDSLATIDDPVAGRPRSPYTGHHTMADNAGAAQPSPGQSRHRHSSRTAGSPISRSNSYQPMRNLSP
jgi:xanthine/uracil/vitamin C permease (AzgA family)